MFTNVYSLCAKEIQKKNGKRDWKITGGNLEIAGICLDSIMDHIAVFDFLRSHGFVPSSSDIDDFYFDCDESCVRVYDAETEKPLFHIVSEEPHPFLV